MKAYLIQLSWSQLIFFFLLYSISTYWLKPTLISEFYSFLEVSSDSAINKQIKDASGEELSDQLKEVLSLKIFPLTFAGAWQLKTGSSIFGEPLQEQRGKILMNWNGGLNKSDQHFDYQAPDIPPAFDHIQMLIIEGDALENSYHGKNESLKTYHFDAKTFVFYGNADHFDFQINMSRILLKDKSKDNRFTLNDTASISTILTSRKDQDISILEAELQIDLISYKSKNSYILPIRIAVIFIFLTNTRHLMKTYSSPEDEKKSLNSLITSILFAWDLISFTNLRLPLKSEFWDSLVISLARFISVVYLAQAMAGYLVQNKRNFQWTYLKSVSVFLFLTFASFWFRQDQSSNSGFSFAWGFYFLSNLYLLPQIIENARKKRPVSFESATEMDELMNLRLLLLTYLALWEQIFYFPTISEMIASQIGVLFQWYVLDRQSTKGPFFFVPDFLRFDRYNYFQEIESGNESEVCQSCMENLKEDPPEEMRNNHKVNSILEKKKIKPGRVMMTECGHRFHAFCFIEWMLIRMKCLTCGDFLTPLK